MPNTPTRASARGPIWPLGTPAGKTARCSRPQLVHTPLYSRYSCTSGTTTGGTSNTWWRTGLPFTVTVPPQSHIGAGEQSCTASTWASGSSARNAPGWPFARPACVGWLAAGRDCPSQGQGHPTKGASMSCASPASAAPASRPSARVAARSATPSRRSAHGIARWLPAWPQRPAQAFAWDHRQRCACAQCLSEISNLQEIFHPQHHITAGARRCCDGEG